MLVDFSKTFKNFDGTDIPETPESKEHFAIRAAAINALLYQEKGEVLSGQESLKRFDLATYIYSAAAPITLDSGQIELIKQQITKIYGPMIVGQSWKMLEGEL